MIGEKVSREQLEELIALEKSKDEIVGEVTKELKALKPGECLVYKTIVGMESIMSLSLSFSRVSNLKLITRPGKVYAYKEK